MVKPKRPPFDNHTKEPPLSGENSRVQFSEEAEMEYFGDERGQENMAHIENVKVAHENELMAIRGVTGVGIELDDLGKPAIVVYVEDKSVAKLIPTSLEGYRVQPRVTGVIEPLPRKV